MNVLAVRLKCRLESVQQAGHNVSRILQLEKGWLRELLLLPVAFSALHFDDTPKPLNASSYMKNCTMALFNLRPNEFKVATFICDPIHINQNARSHEIVLCIPPVGVPNDLAKFSFSTNGVWPYKTDNRFTNHFGKNDVTHISYVADMIVFHLRDSFAAKRGGFGHVYVKLLASGLQGQSGDVNPAIEYLQMYHYGKFNLVKRTMYVFIRENIDHMTDSQRAGKRC
jgi:hypothetical protein